MRFLTRKQIVSSWRTFVYGVIATAIIVGTYLLAFPGLAHAEPVFGPGIGSDTFVPWSLKCYGTKRPQSNTWSLTIEGDWVGKRAADFGLFYYNQSDPESNPDASKAQGPIIDKDYHVTLNGQELSQPVSRVLTTDGKPRHLKFQLNGVAPDQTYSLKAIWEDQARRGVPFPNQESLVTMRADDTGMCNPR